MSGASSVGEVVLVGAAITDLQVYPVGRDLLDAPSYSAERMVWTVGGDAINEATIISRLGHSARLVSCVGDDDAGHMLVDHCRRNGIDTKFLKVDPSKTTAINIGLIAPDGERIFINNKSGNLWTLSLEDINTDALSEGRILSFASIFNSPLLDERAMLTIFEKAKERGMIISADVVTPKRGETLQDIRQALSYIDYFFPNFTEGRALSGRDDPDEIADVFLNFGVKNVILKTGKSGCLVKNASQRFTVPGYPKSNCIDTTGAGDNFASGFLCALLEGMGLENCAQFANCVASIAVEAVGATCGVQNRAQVNERYSDYKNLLGLN